LNSPKVKQALFRPEPETLLPASELDALADVSAGDIDDAIGDWKADPPILAFADLLEAETDA